MKDDEYWVKSGDIKSGTWRLSNDVFTDGETAIKIAKLTSCTIVKDEHTTTQSGSGRIAGGILGAALLGPIGAIGGLLSGGKKRIDETIIHCGFDDNRAFTAESTQIGAASLVRIAQQNLRSAPVAKNEPSTTVTGISGDLIECPQCAELIKRKAKICRYCGSNLTGSESLDQIVEGSASGCKAIANGPYRNFLADYRSQVQDSPFSADQSVIDVINKFSELRKSDPETWVYKCQQKLAKEFKVSTLDIIKIFDDLIPTTMIVDKCINRYGCRLNRDDVRLIIQVISDARLEKTYDSDLEKVRVELGPEVKAMLEERKSRPEVKAMLEKNAREVKVILERMRNKTEKVVSAESVEKVQDALPSWDLFYTIDDHMIKIDMDTRKKKAIKKAAKKKITNSKIKKIISSSEFIEWYEAYIDEDEDIAPEDVVRFYCGSRDLNNLFIEKNSEDYALDDFVEMIVTYWELDEKKGSSTPDEWLSANLRDAICNFNVAEENKIDDELLISVFEGGFNSVTLNS